MSTPPQEKDEDDSGGRPVKNKELTMTEYCKKLENWLLEAYYQRAVVTSAYFTALNTSYGPPGGYVLGGGVFAPGVDNPPPFNMNNNDYAAQQQQQAQRPQPQQIFVPHAQRPNLLMFLANAVAAAHPRGPIPPNNIPGAGATPATTATVSTAVVLKLAPVWKRFLAEVIDFLFLLVIKLFITFTVIDTFELIDLDSIDLEALRDNTAGGPGDAQLQSLYEIALSLTSELLLLELTHRIVVCFFEAYCLWKAGGTPGKTMLGLRVVHAVDILPFSPHRINVINNNNVQQQQLGWDMTGNSVIVRPGSYLTFPRAFLRSCLKNFSLAFFFPLCFTLFHFDNSRTLYDLMAHSLVVEI